MQRLLMVWVFLMCQVTMTWCQEADIVVIGEITIVGNKRTRKFVLNREMDFRSGDTILLSEFQQTLLRNENHLINTGLFVSVSVTAPEWHKADRVADILVEVNETWYFFPIPVLRLADRNFNVWWEDYDRDLSRVIWGIKGHHYNLTGVRDYLKVVAQFGFSQKYQIRYRYPYLNKEKTLGLELEALYFRSRNGLYDTQDNQQQFLISDLKDNYKSLVARVTTKYRPAHYMTHEFGISFVSSAISDTVRALNPGYYFNNSAIQRYFSLRYGFRNDRRDRRYQATRGYMIEGYITQVGMGLYSDLNYGFAQLQLKKYFPVSDKVIARLSTTGRWYFNKNKISYNHSQALGYGSLYVRGYEHYVVDGTDFFLSHQGLAWQLYKRTWNFNKILPAKKLDVIPVRLFLSANIDIGYVRGPQYPEQNSLDKQWLYGYGPALELLIAEGYLFGLDYSFKSFGRIRCIFTYQVQFLIHASRTFRSEAHRQKIRCVSLSHQYPR